ncbi:hypothetical protein F385_3053 [Pantoea agglomerans 299R]|jgi:hypothetical protein|nr:hypothetical protein F385_3053 [Pantoea agglomerans 299R]
MIYHGKAEFQPGGKPKKNPARNGVPHRIKPLPYAAIVPPDSFTLLF